MTEKQFEELLAALGRIATALEVANLREMYPPQWVAPAPAAYPTVANGYTCQKCWQWVQSGAVHTCNNFGTAG